MKMKELEIRTGVSRESIRYYIREGLLPQPDKPKRNVAEYGPEHIERTQLIKRLQDEHFLPLKVVRDILGKVTDKASLSKLSRPALAQLLPSLIHDTQGRAPSTLAKLVASTDFTIQEVEEMAKLGAISIGVNGEVAARDAEIVRLWAAAHTAGFTSEHGYDHQFLEEYVAIAQQWSKLETGLYLAAFADQSDSEAAAAGARGLEIGSRLMSLLRTNATLRAIEGLPDPDGHLVEIASDGEEAVC